MVDDNTITLKLVSKIQTHENKIKNGIENTVDDNTITLKLVSKIQTHERL